MRIGIFPRWYCPRTMWIVCSLTLLFLLILSAYSMAQEDAGGTEGSESGGIVTDEGSTMMQEPEVAQRAEKTSWLGFLAKGGLTMIPIALCSIGFIAIVAAKSSIFRLMRFRINTFAEAITNDVSSGNIEGAIGRCEETDNAITRPLKRGLMAYRRDPARTGDSLREAMLDEVPGLESYIGWLGIIAGIAPLLGLFGTVVGIIQAFVQLASGGAAADPDSFMRLADGIYKALITTAAGLFVGIPALVMYEYFRMKITDLMRDMDRLSVSLLNALGVELGDQL